jgi:hypothetical protein
LTTSWPGHLYDCGRRDDGLDRDHSGNRNGRDTTVAVDLCLGAVAGDVASLTAAVARLTSRVERTAVRGSAVTGDMAELAAGVALHGLSLTIAGKVVGASTFVAGGRTRATSEAAPEATETATGSSGAAAHGRARAVAGEMASHTAAVAAAAGAGTAQAQSGAVGLDVAEALAVVALLGLGSAGMGASVGLVARLLAVVAEPLRRRAHLSIVADVAALEARAARERRHVCDCVCGVGERERECVCVCVCAWAWA